MAKKNLEARRRLHHLLKEAELSGEITGLEYYAAYRQTDCLFLDRTGDPIWVDFVLDSIEYGDAKCNRSVGTLDEMEIKNDSDVTLEETLTRKESFSQQTTFSFTEGIKVGMSEKATFTLGLDELLKLGVEVTYNYEFDFQAQQSFTCQRSKEFDVNTKVSVPPHHSVTATIEVDKVHFTGPFTAYYIPVFTAEGRREWDKQMEDTKEWKGRSLKPLVGKPFMDLFPTVRNRLRIPCKGSLDGTAGINIKVVLSEPKGLAVVL